MKIKQPRLDFGADEALSVTDLTRHIQKLFMQDERLRQVWVEGEVSNLRAYQSGHVYFTLKDELCQLRSVMWRSDRGRQSYQPQDGEHVRVRGRVEVYDARGEYQLVAEAIQPVGVGALYLQFERLKARLEAEGLFDPAHKRPLPLFPRVIGVVTSPLAAAFQDIQNVLRRRYPIAEILLSPTPVQGDGAPVQIVAALEALFVDGRADVILLARGGGSLEDLWAFNDEAVVRAVHASPIPIVTGVGHEIDFTLVDFAADQRAPTPSAGAEVITPDRAELSANIRALHAELLDSLADRIDRLRRDLVMQRRALVYVSPRVALDNQRQRVDDLRRRLTSAADRQLDGARDRLAGQTRALASVNPANVLARGYAIVYRHSDGVPVLDPAQIPPGTSITVQVQQGRAHAITTAAPAADQS